MRVNIRDTLTKVIIATKEVFTKPKYILIAVGFATLLFSFNTTISNISLLKSMFSLKLLILLITGSGEAMGGWMVTQLIVLSLLAGMVLSMSTYIIIRQIAFNTAVGTTSIFTSIIAPCCPSCAMGLLPVLGIGGFLSFLPFKGEEIGFISIILLAFTVLYLSKKITTVTCEVIS